MIFEPGRYEGVPAYRLLEAAGHGYIAVDQRLLHALLDRPETLLPDLVRFAAEDHSSEAMDLDPLLIDLFHALKTPEALPFFVRLIRQNPGDIADDLIEAVAPLGEAAVEPLLGLLAELGDEKAGDVPFVLAGLRVRDARVLEVLTQRVDEDPQDAALCLELYGDPAAIPALEAALEKIPAEDSGARRPIESAIKTLANAGESAAEAAPAFDIFPLYPKTASPDFTAMEDEDLLAMLEHGSSALKAEVALSSPAGELTDPVGSRLLQLAKTDPDAKVRGACWEALAEFVDDPDLHRAMLKVMADTRAAVEERSGVVIALAEQSDSAAIYQAILNLYQDPAGRAAALKAMARSFDKRFASYPPKHLDDADPALRTQAIWGVGYLNLSSDATRLVDLFDDERFRTDALFAYALAVPGETSPGRVQALMSKVEKAAGGFREDEEDLVRIALDQRLMMHGKDPVFFPDDVEKDDIDEEEVLKPVIAAPKPGRNDLCSCGSGKKYKKCHGLVN